MKRYPEKEDLDINTGYITLHCLTFGYTMYTPLFQKWQKISLALYLER
jgi:hypothetical protein